MVEAERWAGPVVVGLLADTGRLPGRSAEEAWPDLAGRRVDAPPGPPRRFPRHEAILRGDGDEAAT